MTLNDVSSGLPWTLNASQTFEFQKANVPLIQRCMGSRREIFSLFFKAFCFVGFAKKKSQICKGCFDNNPNGALLGKHALCALGPREHCSLQVNGS